MATSDRTISKPIVNILTKAQYQGISSPSADEFYLITDDAAVSAGTGISVNTTGGETIVSLDSSYGLTTSDITTGTDTTNKLVSAKTIADVLGAAGSVTDVQVGGTSILNNGVANIITNSTYNSSSNKIATMSDLPSIPTAGTTASAVGTTASGGSATTWSKSDHVHSISSSTITSALGYTPASGDTKVKLTSVTSSSEYPLVLGPSSISSGTAYEGNYVSSITVNASSRQLTLQSIKLDYNSDCYATISINGYSGTTTENTPNVTFYSLKGNSGDTSNHNVYLKGIATPSSDYDAANKKYVDTAVGAISDTKVTNTLATTTKYYVTGTTSSTTNTGTQSFDSGIYATTTAGQLNATTYLVNEKTRLEYNSTTNSLDFIFI